LKEAQQILHSYKDYSPIAYVRAADIQFMAARVLSDAEANRVFLSLEPILKDALHLAQTEPKTIDQSTVVTALSLLGFGYEFLNRFQEAVDCYSTVLDLEPNNDAILVARGMLLYGGSPQGIADLERAVQLGSPLIWPYAMLAFHALKTHRYKECMRLCELALERDGSPAMKSEIHEWEGAAQAALDFSPGSFALAFEQAVRTDTANDRAKRNLQRAKHAPRKSSPDYWELRTEEAVRKSALTERRYAMAGT
jgi:tetratricopeptide (TPR) repeat protein